MRTVMTVTWHCTRCGTKGRLVYETAVPRDHAARDVYATHGIPLGCDFTSLPAEHCRAIVIHLRHKKTASTQQRLFE